MWLYILTGTTFLCVLILIGVCVYCLVQVGTLTRRKKLDSYSAELMNRQEEKERLRKQVEILQDYVDYRQNLINRQEENQKNESQIKEDNK